MIRLYNSVGKHKEAQELHKKIEKAMVTKHKKKRLIRLMIIGSQKTIGSSVSNRLEPPERVS